MGTKDYPSKDLHHGVCGLRIVEKNRSGLVFVAYATNVNFVQKIRIEKVFGLSGTSVFLTRSGKLRRPPPMVPAIV
ncbi:protein of unknown function [Hyphomicrobium sp. MC1]|nr:protein of unknown function [Hyphomicrobium sp. MC1]